jgi:hypothetical protein
MHTPGLLDYWLRLKTELMQMVLLVIIVWTVITFTALLSQLVKTWSPPAWQQETKEAVNGKSNTIYDVFIQLAKPLNSFRFVK